MSTQAPTKKLPARPSLEHLKSQAKELLDAYRRSDAEAYRRFREFLPAARGATDAQLAEKKLALHDAQSALAREYGFESWNAMRTFVETQSHAPSQAPSPEALRALLQHHMSAPMPPEVLAALRAMPAAEPIALPATLPVVPVRNALLAAGVAAPLHLARPSSLAAIAAAKDGVIALFAQEDAADDDPDERGLHRVGCAARIVKALPAENGSWIVVRAAQWVQLDVLTSKSPYLAARVSAFLIDERASETIEHLHRALKSVVHASLAQMPDSARLAAMTDGMSPLALADTAIANLPCSVGEKARYASLPQLEARLRLALDLLQSTRAPDTSTHG